MARRSVGADDAADLSISELRRALRQIGVDYRDAVEKSDLVSRLRKALAGGRVEIPDAGSGLTEAERRNVSLFERCAPSVAFIHTTRGRPTGPFDLDPTEHSSGSGSGFVWDHQGHIVTNYHVIRGASAAQVTINRGRSYTAKLVGAEPEYDLAVLKIAAPRGELQPLQIGSSADLQVGRFVAAIGNPFGLDHTYTTGVVSALGRSVQGPQPGRKLRGCIQTDAAINPGNSGGPLLDSQGLLVGVAVAIASPSGASAGIGFAIPVDTVRRVVGSLVSGRQLRRATLGVGVADDQLLRQVSRSLRTPLEGALVLSVQAGGPADLAGLRPTSRTADGLLLGDIITHVAGVRVRGVEDLTDAVESRAAGSVVILTLARVDGTAVQHRKVRTALAERPVRPKL
eukprot:TRINITY_DN13023_c0_g1_i1.p1 TRINITY_DN13023_c0_g1~~TRINITY_DN13023_c0_g1_i1.p1  ORF type:complete len:399 (+),score=127.65 TRINITY_DN13023_c0_g1_i1:52-1248(+)